MCQNEDPAVVTRTGVAKIDLKDAGIFSETEWGGHSEVAYTVTCGIRQKLTVCPLSNSRISECVVRKSCGGYSQAVTRETHPGQLWSKVITHLMLKPSQLNRTLNPTP